MELRRKRSEWRRLGARIVAISSDDARASRAMAEELKLRFPLLNDPTLSVIDRYGVRHAGKDIALPAMFVVTRERKLAWAKVAQEVWDRPAWAELRDVLVRLAAKPKR